MPWKCFPVNVVLVVWVFFVLFFFCSVLFFYRSKKVSVPSTVISRVIGRGGCNINAIRECTGAHIDIDKQKDKTGDRIITIR